ncbi:MAG: SBBP repeat-containing protein [Candidatus Sulfotelmatobacter sp.]
MKASFASLPLGFEQNYGQTDPQVKYMAHANGYTLFLTSHDAVFAFHGNSSTSERPTGHGPLALPAKNESQAQPNSEAVIRMQLVGGNSNALVAASDQLPGKSNYIRGQNPKNWHTNVSHYARVSYRNIYPGINLAYHGEQSKLEFDFIVAPESNPAPIDLAFNGAQHLAIDASGDLLVSSGAGDVVLHKPVAYQQEGTTRQPVDARFVLKADKQVRFELGSYDRSRELVIDPTVTYATYLGGNTEDDAYAIAFDGTGAAYVTGQTDSSTFPKQGGLPGNTLGLNFAVFVTKLAANGQSLVYSTYVDGGGSDTGVSSGNAIAVDASGDAFVAGGTTSTIFPVTGGAFQNVLNGGPSGSNPPLDGFVFKLNATGNQLTYCTYLGGSSDDVANGIALDGSGNVYVVGATTSSDFPTKNPIQTSLVSKSDAFVTELNPGLSALVYSTWLGGGSLDFASAVAVDPSSSTPYAYVTGGTGSTAFPFTPGAFQTACNSCTGTLYNAFVTVINNTGSGYIYSTYLGGGNNDEGFGIAVDSSGDAYVTGMTNSSNFPVTGSAYQSAFGGGSSDAFVTELNPTGTAQVYSTFLGGGANDVGTSIAVDQGGNAYVTGQTGSTDFPKASPTQSSLAGGNDAFVSEVNSAGSGLIFSTYLGGALNENTPANGGSGALGGIAVDAKGDSFYVTGNTASTDFPFTPSAFQTTNKGVQPPKVNAFVANYSQPSFTVSASALTPASVTPAGSATSTVTIAAVNSFSGSVTLSCAVSGPSNAVSPPTCLFATNPVAGGAGTSGLTVSTTATTSGGVYAITVIGTDASGMAHSATVTLTVNAANFMISATSPAPVAPGGTATSTVTLTSFDGYSLPVNLTCTVLGSGSPLPTCSATSFSVNPVTPTSGGTSSTLTITTTAPGAALIRPRKIFYAMWLPIAGLSLLGIGFKTSRSHRRKLLGLLLLGMVMAGLFLLPSCGGSSSNGGGGGGSCAAAPSAPTGLAGGSTTQTGTTLTWTAATAGANCSVTGYTVYENENGNYTSIGTATGTTFPVTGLTPSTTYSFTVAASDSAGLSAQSSPASVMTLTAGTPIATYTITITGTDANNLTHSTMVNLTLN